MKRLSTDELLKYGSSWLAFRLYSSCHFNDKHTVLGNSIALIVFNTVTKRTNVTTSVVSSRNLIPAFLPKLTVGNVKKLSDGYTCNVTYTLDTPLDNYNCRLIVNVVCEAYRNGSARRRLRTRTLTTLSNKWTCLFVCSSGLHTSSTKSVFVCPIRRCCRVNFTLIL